MRNPIQSALAVFLSGALLVFASCRSSSPSTGAEPPEGANEAYAPGLGEIMSAQQMRHTKLWFAGEAGNWNLAAYEVDELGEGFDDVVKFHPMHKDSPVAPKDAIPRIVTEPLNALRAVVESKNAAAFAQAYDGFTAACNQCHEAMNFGFNVVQRPTANPYSDQVFTPAAR